MGSFMDNMFKTTTNKSSDENVAFFSLAGLAASSTAYLAATLEASTPEIRRLFSEYTTQNVMAHGALTEFVINKGWYVPYESPDMQLQSSIDVSQSVILDVPN